MTNWWDADPVASAPSAVNWWDTDPVAGGPAGEPLQVKIAAAPKPEDPRVATVRAERERARAAGEPAGDPFQRLLGQGMSMGFLDEAAAVAATPIEMIKRGTLDPREGYEWAKAGQNWELEDARKRAGYLGTAAEVAGGVTTGVGAYRAGATLAPAIASRLGGGLFGTAAGAGADAGAFGAIAGFGEGEDGERLTGAAAGGALGATLGAGIPLSGAALGTVASPILSQVSARWNPSRYADRQIGSALAESRLAPDEVAARVARAAHEGQGEYRLMDALGNAGRRKAAVVAKNPGEGRTQMVEFFDQRQAGQGQRVANALEEGLGAPETAAQAEARLTAARTAQDNAAFPALRNNADPVDVAPVLATIDNVLEPGLSRAAEPPGPLAPDSIEAVLGRARALLAGGDEGVTRTGFGSVQRARDDIADAATRAYRAGEGNKYRLLAEVRGALDAQMEAASQGYRDAMAQSARAARETNAVGFGAQAARRGRVEDKLAAFNRMTPAEQAAFRYGYADPLITQAQAGAVGADASRPLTSLARRTEMEAFAPPGQADILAGRLAREADMFRTRNVATGNSATSENLADSAATGIDPAIIGQLLSGNLWGAGRSALQRTYAQAGGNTEEVRRLLAERLLNGSPAEIRALLTQLHQRTTGRRTRGAIGLRGSIEGLLAATNQ